MTECASCKHIGTTYWGHHSDYGGKTHSCGKSGERRHDQMRPTGNFAEDFMQNFRTFFDAKANQRSCKYYEEREVLQPPQLKTLQLMAAAGGKSAFKFLSDENAICERMDGRFVERDEDASRQRAHSDGTRDWRLTKVGEAEVKRAGMQSEPV